jgi:hypothetical protein
MTVRTSTIRGETLLLGVKINITKILAFGGKE